MRRLQKKNSIKNDSGVLWNEGKREEEKYTPRQKWSGVDTGKARGGEEWSCLELDPPGKI
jgi:hypothetical protein